MKSRDIAPKGGYNDEPAVVAASDVENRISSERDCRWNPPARTPSDLARRKAVGPKSGDKKSLVMCDMFDGESLEPNEYCCDIRF